MWGPRHVHTWGLTQEPSPCSWGPWFQVQGGAWGLEPQTDQKAVGTVGIVARGMTEPGRKGGVRGHLQGAPEGGLGLELDSSCMRGGWPVTGREAGKSLVPGDEVGAEEAEQWQE